MGVFDVPQIQTFLLTLKKTYFYFPHEFFSLLGRSGQEVAIHFVLEPRRGKTSTWVIFLSLRNSCFKVENMAFPHTNPKRRVGKEEEDEGLRMKVLRILKALVFLHPENTETAIRPKSAKSGFFPSVVQL